MTIFMYVLSFMAGIAVALIQRYIMRNMRFNKKDQRTAAHNNIGVAGRVLRFCIATTAFAYAVYTGSEIAFIIAGYTYYEAFAKWCGFYALIGRNSCPL